MINWPDLIVDDIARRRAVLFLGAGVSRNSVGAGGKRPVLWQEFLEVGLKRCASPHKHIAKLIKAGDYLTACEIIKKKLEEDFRSLLSDCFATPQFQPADIHKYIFDLDVNIVATPNFDKIYDTYAQSQSKNTVQIKNYYDVDLAVAVRGDTQVILKVHGTIDQPAKMIFTRQEYLAARYQHGSFYTILDALAITHTFIFLGCGLSDPDIRLVLENHAHMHPHSRPHYMVMPRGMHLDIQESVKANLNLKIISYDPSNGHKDLTDSLGELVSQVETRRQQFAATMNW